MEKKILTSIQVGPMTLKNRIMFPPLTTDYEERDGSIGPRSLAFYERLAKGGTAYVVIGDVSPVRSATPTPKLCDDAQIPTYKRLADALHKYDCKLGLQLFHPEYDVVEVGRMIMAAVMMRQAAAKENAEGNKEAFAAKNVEAERLTREAYGKMHHDMQFFVSEASVQKLDAIRESMAAAAVRAEQAGVDAIEVHGDRLLGSLCSPLLNHRSDEYGGSFENRTRYALEVVQALKQAAPGLAIEYKLPVITVNPDGSLRGKGGLLADEAVEFAKLLEKAGVDMIQVAQANHTGNMGDTIPPMGSLPYNWILPVTRRVKAVVGIPVATVGRVISVESGEQILQDGDADVIAYGRSLLADPDIAEKTARGECIRECLNCNRGCVDAVQERKIISCVLNAENGNEATVFLKPAETVKKVAVVGGGLAGLEAARVAAKRGHKVTLFEKSHRLGGQILLAAVPPRKSEILRSVAYFESILPVLGVDIQYGRTVRGEELNEFDHCIIAVGAHNMDLPMEVQNSNVVSSWDILSGAVDAAGKCVVLGGGLVGTETAEYLARKGLDVTIVEMMDKIAAGESTTVLPLILEDFGKNHVKQMVNTRVSRIADNTVYAVNTAENREVVLQADTIVGALGSRKNLFDTAGITCPVTFVGDCSGDRTANIAEAIRSGYHAANEI